jgi:hypothetical protein
LNNTNPPKTEMNSGVPGNVKQLKMTNMFVSRSVSQHEMWSSWKWPICLYHVRYVRTKCQTVKIDQYICITFGKWHFVFIADNKHDVYLFFLTYYLWNNSKHSYRVVGIIYLNFFFFYYWILVQRPVVAVQIISSRNYVHLISLVLLVTRN